MIDWPASKVVDRKVADLSPNAKNSRTHSKSQVQKIVASIREFGWTNPVLIDEEGMIIAGHGRILAAEMMGTQSVPCIVAKGWSDEQKRAYMIADNQLALDAGWDKDILRSEIEGLGAAGFDLDLLGFDAPDLKSLMDGGHDLTTVNEQPVEKPEDPVTKRGDLWILGRHRILCGDSTSREDVDRLLGGETPFMMVTDPPYGVDYDPNWRNEAGVAKSKRTGTVMNDERADWSEAWALFPGVVAYVWHAGKFASVVANSLDATGFEIRSQIVWSKSRFAISRGNYHWQHEPCFYAIRDKDKLTKEDERAILRDIKKMMAGAFEEDHVPCWYAIRRTRSAKWIGDRKQSTIWEIPVTDDGERTRHGTQKPLECMGRAIRNHDSDLVYEPFSGSGTTLVASEIIGRRCLAMELDPAYVDMAIVRWQNRSGAKAVSEDGVLFDDLRGKQDA